MDEMVANIVEPMVRTTGNTVDMSDLINPLNQIRQRGIYGPLGKVKIGLLYDSKRCELKVTIYEAKGLPGGDLPDPPDPYVKLYLLPERNKKSKRKSDAKRDTVEPVFDEVFTYEISSTKLVSQKLEVSMVDKKGIFSRRALMGRAIIDLSDPKILQVRLHCY